MTDVVILENDISSAMSMKICMPLSVDCDDRSCVHRVLLAHFRLHILWLILRLGVIDRIHKHIHCSTVHSHLNSEALERISHNFVNLLKPCYTLILSCLICCIILDFLVLIIIILQGVVIVCCKVLPILRLNSSCFFVCLLFFFFLDLPYMSFLRLQIVFG